MRLMENTARGWCGKKRDFTTAGPWCLSPGGPLGFPWVALSLRRFSQGFQHRFWTSKSYPKAPKMIPKTIKKTSKMQCSFRTSVCFDFLQICCSFRSRPTYDFIGIYSTLVGCNLFRAVRTILKNTSKKAPKMISKSMQNRFKNKLKHQARQKQLKNTNN